MKKVRKLLKLADEIKKEFEEKERETQKRLLLLLKRNILQVIQ